MMVLWLRVLVSGERGARAVIAGHTIAAAEVVSLKGGHTYASGADKVYVVVVVVHCQ